MEGGLRSGFGLDAATYRVIGRDDLHQTRFGSCCRYDPAPFTEWLLGPKLLDGREPPACLPFRPCPRPLFQGPILNLQSGTGLAKFLSRLLLSNQVITFYHNTNLFSVADAS